MKAIIEVDVPDYQIGQEVSIYFKDTMMIKGVVKEQSGDLISRDAVIEIIHRFFTEEVDKIPTKKTEDGEVYVIHKCQPLFEMNKAICKRIKALPSVSPTQNCVGNALDALDCISRQTVNEIINDIRDCISVEGYCAILERLKKLPSVKQEPNIKALGEELRICRESITDEKVLIGFNMAVAICNKHLGESGE